MILKEIDAKIELRVKEGASAFIEAGGMFNATLAGTSSSHHQLRTDYLRDSRLVSYTFVG